MGAPSGAPFFLLNVGIRELRSLLDACYVHNYTHWQKGRLRLTGSMTLHHPDKDETLSQMWERVRSRGYWVVYFLIPFFTLPPAVRSYERHDGHLWIWVLIGGICLIVAILKRP